jgi:hypothetical protein
VPPQEEQRSQKYCDTDPFQPEENLAREREGQDGIKYQCEGDKPNPPKYSPVRNACMTTTSAAAHTTISIPIRKPADEPQNKPETSAVMENHFMSFVNIGILGSFSDTDSSSPDKGGWRDDLTRLR